MTGTTPATRVTRTINPLHFEDLESKRFEDLVRQLAHGFRSWRYLEDTGKLGNDEGIDIRGVEVVGGIADSTGSPELEREWRLQCKRYKTLTPKAIRAIVAEVVPDPNAAPHGLVIATAARVSSDGYKAFHAEAAKQGVLEHHLWSGPLIEDMLFRPENDGLLFAYFGISLTARRRSRVAELRHALAIKKRLLVLSGQDRDNLQLRHMHPIDVVFRDIDDPLNERDETRIGSVHVLGNLHMWVELAVFSGIVFPDGSWAVHSSTRQLTGNHLYWQAYPEAWPSASAEIEAHLEQGRAGAPSEGNAHEGHAGAAQVFKYGLLPYAHIAEVDALGDIELPGLHLHCFYAGSLGPFTKLVITRGRALPERVELDPSREVLLFTPPSGKPLRNLVSLWT